MLAMQKSLPSQALRTGVPALSCRPRTARMVVRSQINADKAVQTPALPKLAALSAAATSLFAAGNVQAATELMQLAESDNRVGIIGLLFLPVIGWVGFNILQPALNQLNNMNNKKSIAAGLGLSAATLLAASNAEAATELMQLAESDNRVGIIGLLFLPVLGWVGFNILQPALNQLNNMNNKKGIAAGLGLSAASLLAASNAEAATQLYQLAESDNRVGIIGLLFLPVLGWVGFNILQPALNQLNNMNGTKRSIAAGLGLTGAALLANAPSAQAAMEIAQVADGDGRVGILGFIFLPALAWVAFNIAAPAKNQLDSMQK